MVNPKPASKPAAKPRSSGTKRTAAASTHGHKKSVQAAARDEENAGKKPILMTRHMQVLDGSRSSRRPNKLARLVGSFDPAQVAWADEFEQPDVGQIMSRCLAKRRLRTRVGYVPAGPAEKRVLPPFKGPTPGPVDTTLNSSASVLRFLSSQITDEFIALVVKYTEAHRSDWRRAHVDWRTDTRELAVKKPKKHFTANEFRMWLACRLRVAQLKPEMPAYCLCDRHSSLLFDAQVFNAMTYYNQWQWINRHLAFADVIAEPDGDTSEDDDDDESAAGDGDEYEGAQEREECSDEVPHG